MANTLLLTSSALIIFLILIPATFFLLQPTIIPGTPAAGYVLENLVTHSRVLPEESSHSFTYPTISLFLSLSDLESGRLNVGGCDGWLFGYGSVLRILGIRSQPYLTEVSLKEATNEIRRERLSIREKLNRTLQDRGWDICNVRDVWIATMPSFLGVEGINPLTVYYIYHPTEGPEAPGLWIIVLEVHNTFDEKHVYILECGVTEDKERSKSFDHQWTFPRQFHVSPFNDRSGAYRCSVSAPKIPAKCLDCAPPRPVVKLQLLTAISPPEVKLTATIRAAYSQPLSVRAIGAALLRAPLTLLLTFPRIAYQAFMLHYKKRLDVYGRPEPISVDGKIEEHLEVPDDIRETDVKPIGGAIAWQAEGLVERWCRKKVERFLAGRVEETGTSVKLVSSNPSIPIIKFSPSSEHPTTEELTIYYRSRQLFTILLTTPSANHALLLGHDAEHHFTPSSRALFLRIFAPSHLPHSPTSLFLTIADGIRRRLVPPSIQADHPICSFQNPLDKTLSWSLLAFLTAHFVMGKLEEWVFTTLKARFIPGGEPWNGWRRLGARPLQTTLGSFRRDV